MAVSVSTVRRTSPRATAPRARAKAPAPPDGPLAIRSAHCKGCELCVGACPHGVLALDQSTVNALGYHSVRLTDPAGCTSCAICARVCPDAIFTIYAPHREAVR